MKVLARKASTMNKPRYLLPAQRSQLLAEIERVRDSEAPIAVTLEEVKPARRPQQNALYWVLLGKISTSMPPHMDGVWYASDVWHEYFKQRYLPAEAMQAPDGACLYRKSTTKLSVSEFSDYYAEIEAWAAEYEVFLA